MTLNNTSKKYGAIAVWLHWSIAILFLLEYITIYYKLWFTEKGAPEGLPSLYLHHSIGISLIAFVILRIIWRTRGPNPDALPGSKWEHFSAKLVHYLLYFFMVAMPVSGYLYAKNSTDFFWLFTIPNIGDTTLGQWLISDVGLDWKEDIRKPMRFFHREIGGELVLWMLILIHAGAALYHHYIRRDSTLRRMLL